MKKARFLLKIVQFINSFYFFKQLYFTRRYSFEISFYTYATAEDKYIYKKFSFLPELSYHKRLFKAGNKSLLRFDFFELNISFLWFHFTFCIIKRL